MPNPPMLYFSFLIRQACSEGLSIYQLDREINEANAGAKTNCSVNRRLLEKLRNGNPKVGLTLQTCIALETYFRLKGKILHDVPLFAYPGIIETLVRSMRVHFLYGAKPRPRERRVDVSCWDLDAGAHVLTAASRACARCEFDISHVLWQGSPNLAAAQSEHWYHVLEADTESVVSIGSPMASLSTEVMLAKMFSVQAFRAPDAQAARKLPFWYCWAPALAGKFRSAFALTAKDLHALVPKTAERVQANQSHAFGLGGDVHEVSRSGRDWHMHGVVVAQRRAAGNLWLVISGLAGPATCAAAKILPEIRAMLPWQPHMLSPIFCQPVIAHVQEGPGDPSRGDIRELADVTLDGSPRFY